MSTSNIPHPIPHHAYRNPRRPARSSVSPWLIRLPLLAGTGAILLVLVLLMIFAGYQLVHQDTIYPGVSTVFGIDLSGMTRQEAILALEERFAYDEQAAITFQYGEQSWTYTAGDLGVTFDAEATVDQAYQAGREGSLLARALDQWDMWLNGYPVTPIITYNETEATHLLQQIARSYINRPVLDATLSLRDGRAIPSPSQIGMAVDIDATLNVLRREFVGLSDQSTLTLTVQQTQPRVRDVSTVADQINVALAAPITLTAPGEENPNAVRTVLELTPDEIENMLVVEPITQEDGATTYEIGVELGELRSALADLAPDLSRTPQNARFVFDDASGQLETIQNSIDGRRVDIEGTLAQVETALFSADPAERRIPLIFQQIPAQISDTATAAELGITELVVQHSTYYHGSSAARRRNIQVATENFHGLVIPPGGVFSFNEWLGDVSVESGYEQGLIIVGNQTITGVGGGVCQVATTAFQTAFYAGFPILERVEHAYRVGYYEEGEGAGLDATVYSPIVDLRFKNDTPYHLLIETYNNPNNSTLTWKFYSTSMNRVVEKDGPYIRNQTNPPPPIYRANPDLAPGQVKQVDYAVSGADVTVYRTIYQDGQVIVDREAFQSTYVPWASQFEVAPGDPRINN